LEWRHGAFGQWTLTFEVSFWNGALLRLSAPKGAEPVTLTDDRNPELVDERIKEVKRYFSSYWKSLR